MIFTLLVPEQATYTNGCSGEAKTPLGSTLPNSIDPTIAL